MPVDLYYLKPFMGFCTTLIYIYNYIYLRINVTSFTFAFFHQPMLVLSNQAHRSAHSEPSPNPFRGQSQGTCSNPHATTAHG